MQLKYQSSSHSPVRHDGAPPGGPGQQLHGGEDPAPPRRGDRPAGRGLVDAAARRLRQRVRRHRKVSEEYVVHWMLFLLTCWH